MSAKSEQVAGFIRTAGLGEENAQTVWGDLSRDIQKDLADFYDELQKFPELSKIISDHNDVETLKKAQINHWSLLFQDELTEEYRRRAVNIGNTHTRIGVNSTWYMSAYAWLLIRFVPVLTEKYRMRPKKLNQALKTLIYRAFYDMILSNSAYEDGVIAEKANEVEHEGDLHNLKNLANTVSDVNEVALDLAYLSGNSREVSVNSQTISAAASELVASVEEIFRNSEGAAADASETDHTVSAGRNAVSKVSESIANIAEAVDETAQSVDQLSKASEQIGQVLTVIEDIAAQTNLLALNATIEAARAGEAGKGFAVVASEVKGLATQTSRSTEDIARRVSSLRTGMNAILSTMEQSKNAVVAGQDAIQDAASTIDQIAEQVGNVSVKMSDIAGILQQQKDSSVEISQSIDRVADTASENEERLVRMAGKLHSSNQRFSESAKYWFKTDSHRATCEMAKIDHVMFKKRVVDILLGTETLDGAGLPDHISCNLGRWYESIKDSEVRDLPAFAKLAAPHRRLHDAARETLDAHARGDKEASMAGLNVLNEASSEVLSVLDELSDMLFGELAHIDRRTYRRKVARGELKTRVGDAEKKLELRNMSSGGAGVTGLTKDDVGKQVQLDDEGEITGTAVWSDGISGGVKFDKPIAEDILKRYLEG